jgi:hypothetical protein
MLLNTKKKQIAKQQHVRQVEQVKEAKGAADTTNDFPSHKKVRAEIMNAKVKQAEKANKIGRKKYKMKSSWVHGSFGVIEHL